MRIFKKFTTFVILAFLMADSVFSQNLPIQDVKSAIDKMAKLIDEKYVFPQKGKAISKVLLEEYRKGKFNVSATWKQFDSLTTECIQGYSNDGHMYVRNDPNTVKELSAVKYTSEKEAIGDQSEDPFFYGKDAVEQNYGFEEVRVMKGNIGYIKLSMINISEKSLPVLAATMQFVSNTRALIIDIQNNGGGGSAVGSVLESYFLPKGTPLLSFRTREGQISLAKTETWLIEKKYNNPVFILTNGSTYSAAEGFAYALQRHKRAKVVGQPSGGGANMNSWYPINEHIFISISTGAPTWPGTEESWEGKGVKPDHIVAEGKEVEYIKEFLSDKK